MITQGNRRRIIRVTPTLTVGSPTAFGSFSELKIKIREAETGASRSFGTTSSGHSKIILNLKRGDFLEAAGHSATIGSMSVKHFFIERV